jgi:3-dehydroquinate synthase
MGHIVLTGFMGTGKTTVGGEVARRLGRQFVDMDAVIETRAGKPIRSIFDQHGETTFRRMEAALCQELAQQVTHTEPLDLAHGRKTEGMVIATGGGSLVDPANRALMMRSGIVVCLNCDAGEILQRVTRDREQNRPLLNVADPHAEAGRLLEARRKAYAAIPWQIDTTALSIEEVAERVIEIAGAFTFPVRYSGGQYDIHLGNGLLSHIGSSLRAAGIPGGAQIAVVSNPTVAALYREEVESSLREAQLEPFACSIPDGEQHKTLATVASLYEQFLLGGLDRSGTVLSLGGGVTGDVAGFAAATFMRGVRFVQMPTTLLAMVDASVGGKTGVDLPQGKNLAGAFKQPELVMIDPSVLATLPVEEMRSGVAEVIKHGIIGDPTLFVELEAGAGATGTWWDERGAARIARALRVKINVVEEDPFEQGWRAVLNLGHTVGHALERLSAFTMRHGSAVAIGMIAAARIAEALGQAEPTVAQRIKEALTTWNLPVRCPPFDAEAIWAAMAHDKKRRGRSLRWVLPRAIGEVEIVEDVPQDVVLSVLQDLGAS